MRKVLYALIATTLLATLAACGKEEAPKTTVQPAAVQPASSPETKPAPIQVATPEPAPPPQVDPNVELAGKVKSALRVTPGLEALAVDVVAADGAVTLFGTADSGDSIKKAGTVASGVPGVKSVQNKMVVVRGS